MVSPMFIVERGRDFFAQQIEQLFLFFGRELSKV